MKKAYRAAVSGIFLALSMGLSALESALPLPLGVKPGFSNIPVMLSMPLLGCRTAFSICVLRSVFVFLTRGTTAFFMSITGGVLSFAVMLVIYKKTKLSFISISVMGSLAHNTGQTLAAAFLMGSSAVMSYIFILAVTGCIAGIVTGTVVTLTIPRIEPFLMRKK